CQPPAVLDQRCHLRRRRDVYARGGLVGTDAVMKTMYVSLITVVAIGMPCRSVRASGHGPLFGAATPTLGRDGWSLDQAWAIRAADDGSHEQMLKTMISYGITENLQVSGSVPLALGGGNLASARSMSMMSGGREFETLFGYRFQRR